MRTLFGDFPGFEDLEVAPRPAVAGADFFATAARDADFAGPALATTFLDFAGAALLLATFTFAFVAFARASFLGEALFFLEVFFLVAMV